MSFRSPSRHEPGLFDDLPLQTDAPPRRERPHASATPLADRKRQPSPQHLPLFPETPGADDGDATEDSPALEGGPTPDLDSPHPTTRWPRVPVAARLRAGLVDLGVVAAVLLATWIGLRSLGIAVRPGELLPLLSFLLPFSFLYQVFPLAFWGCTPGMTLAGLAARSPTGRSITFSQAALRWVGSALTVLTCGLPLVLLARGGESLTDRLSGTRTVPAK